MGYIAYASGTLIIAALLHSIYTKRTKAIEETRVLRDVINPAGKALIETDRSDVKEEENQQAFTPLITIEVSEHDSTHEKDQSAPKDERKTESLDSRNDTNTQNLLNGHIKPHDARSMPPPPLRPSSAPNLDSPASIARHRAAMGPPSSLPPSRSRSPPRLKPATVSSLAPTPRLAVPNRQPQPPQPSPSPDLSGGRLTLTPATSQSTSMASSLRVPQQKVLTNTRMQPQPRSQLDPNALTTSTQAPSQRPSRKVILSPGHSPLDWAALTRSTSPTATTKLRGSDASTFLGPYRLGRITPSQLKAQTGRRGKDAWTVYQGKVYNIAAYLDFHPGGRDELMKGAGRSSDSLFAEVHPWVNWEGMLSGCLVGLLVAEDDPRAMGQEEEKGNELDEMD